MAVPALSVFAGGVRNPLQILGASVLLAWYDANQYSGSDGDAVATWNDSSGNARTLTQGTAGKKPTYKTNIINTKPVMRFDGGDTLAAATALVNHTTTKTFFAVIRQTSVADQEFFANDASGNGTNLRFRNNAGTQQIRAIVGQKIFDANTGIGANTWAYYTTIQNATDSTSSTIIHRANGAVLGTSSSSLTVNSAGANMYIGSIVDTGEYLNGDIAELLFCEGALTSTQYLEIENYLKAKYAL